MIEDPAIVQTEARRIAYIHVVVSREDVRRVIGPGLSELRTVLAEQKVEAVGPWLTHHLQRPAEMFDFQICIPVAAEVTASGRVESGELPTGTAARAVYRGPYERLGDAWREFTEWIDTNGHAASQDLWEVYGEKGETELYQPLAR